MGNLIGSYYRGPSQQVYSVLMIQLGLPASTDGYSGVTQHFLAPCGQEASYSLASRPSLNLGCFNYGEKDTLIGNTLTGRRVARCSNR